MSADLENPPMVEPAPPRRLSDDFRELLRESAGRDTSVGELEKKLQGRGFALFILLLAIPFCVPLPLFGLSIPFGVVIMLMGLRVAMGRKPKLPDFVLNKEIKFKTLDRIVHFGLKICGLIEKVARPRMHFMRKPGLALCLIGVGLASGGLQLLLPIPPVVPLSNTIPAISVVLLTAGMIERDGVFVLAGYFVNLSAWVYFLAAAFFTSKGVEYVTRLFGS